MATNAPRICLLTDTFHPQVGGGETHARLLCREWSRAGLTVRVLTRRLTADLPPQETLDGFSIRRLPPAGFKRFGKYLMVLPTYCELRRRGREYDLIYVCSLRVAGIPAVLAARRLGKPCVLRAESRGELSGDFIWQSPDEKIRRSRFKPAIAAYLRWRNRLLLQASAFVSLSSEIHAEYLRCGVPGSRAHLIHNGIDTERFAPAGAERRRALRAALGLPAAFIGMYTGKLNKGKGLEMLLRAWARLAAERPDVHLVLVGGGGGQFLSCEDELRDFVQRAGLQNRVTFAGFRANVDEYLQAADAFVFPSESEALSIALLEAQACELPCLASDIPGNREIVEDGRSGRLLPVHDEDAWLRALRAWADRPDAAADLGRQGRRTVTARFSIARAAARHLELFRSLIESQAAPSP